ncbi:MAG: hypothetical protein MAG453_00252 [Calditrichaeota bacterium]|nr:hypothetical protein [Calditrichota bacterium]
MRAPLEKKGTNCRARAKGRASRLRAKRAPVREPDTAGTESQVEGRKSEACTSNHARGDGAPKPRAKAGVTAAERTLQYRPCGLARADAGR